ncbi:MAG: hypothetical protein J6U54_12065 [Clostridiales bacterium]|nr:hypothetical protein [Clostridiales bacterium]
MKRNNFGWINDPSHPIKPRPDKRTIKDIIFGLIPIVFGIGYITKTSFLNGAHAYEKSEFEVLDELDLLRPSDPSIDDIDSDIL